MSTTACKWDSIIPLEPMWEQLKRVIKPNGDIVMTASQPFTSILVCSNIGMFRHQWVWDKRFAANYAQAKYAPQKIHEDVLVFSLKKAKYYPIMTLRDKPIKKGTNKGSAIYGGSKGLDCQSYKGKVYTHKYPETIVEFNVRDGRGLHPTQKPVALMEYLIKTYTNEGETVLDFTMGSGTTGVACVNTNRSFIGIELDEGYFEIASKRIADAKEKQTI
jgi:site-specific DNA-methyltransferase (adenine-specific)